MSQERVAAADSTTDLVLCLPMLVSIRVVQVLEETSGQGCGCHWNST
jgi:hypothetical protein